ncbi:TasA family protein [Neobacillus sp. NPDC093127]|uniref:TasA family protein n=1 Tax=Neobacillus sp. NPDC093127 TaxID=3364296 RepID=UPI003822F899
MSKKTKLGMGIASSALALSLIAGGSYALFTHQTANENNTFTGGIVKISDATAGKVASKMLYFKNLAPGDTDTKQITIKNDGNLDAWVRVNDQLTQASRSGDLFAYENALKISYSNVPVKVEAGKTVKLDVTYSFPKNANDYYQNKTGSINIVVDAVQVRNNEDFGIDALKPSTINNFITQEDFSIARPGNAFGGGVEHTGYSVGWHLEKSLNDAKINSMTIELYSNDTLLQRNTATKHVFDLTGKSFSTPFEYSYKGDSSKRFTDAYWNFSDWLGDPAATPTKAVITLTTSDGFTYTQTAYPNGW